MKLHGYVDAVKIMLFLFSLLYEGDVSWTKNRITDLNHLSQKLKSIKFPIYIYTSC